MMRLFIAFPFQRIANPLNLPSNPLRIRIR